MSHHHISWPAMRSDLQPIQFEEKDKPLIHFAYKPKKSETIATLSMFTTIAVTTLLNVKNRAHENRNLKDVGAFCINPFTSIQDTSEKLKYRPNDSKMKEFMNMSGLAPNEYSKCWEKSVKIAEDYFNKNGKPTFMYGVKHEEIDNWYKTNDVAMRNFAYTFFGIKANSEEVDFLPEDLDAFGISKNTIKTKPTELSCVSFVFLKTHEIKAKEFIFKENTDALLKNIFSFLKDWNYRSVKDPDEGDLIVYVGDDKEPTHIGYLNAQGLVSSKLGIANRSSHTHKLFDIPGGYGTTLLFFRKSTFFET